MNLKITSEGLDKAINFFRKLEQTVLSEKLFDYIADKAIDEINKIAQERLQNSENYIANNKYKKISKGIEIYNDSETKDGINYSLIIEFGSGVYAEGEPFHHTFTYEVTGGLYWLVPVEEGSNLFETDYEIITLESGDYFKVYGQEPKHIYTDAAKIIEKELPTWANEFIESEMS